LGICDCYENPACSVPLYASSDTSDEAEIMRHQKDTCYVADDVLESAIDVLYSTLIWDTDSGKTYSEYMLNLPPLDPALTRFNLSAPFRELVMETLVEEMVPTAQFDDYYASCEPKQCSYTEKTRRTPAEIIAFVLGLYGGLSNLLTFLIPLVVRLFVKPREDELMPPPRNQPPGGAYEPHHEAVQRELVASEMRKRSAAGVSEVEMQ
jgi:hypothetical protein